jgi:hypothetical protein
MEQDPITQDLLWQHTSWTAARSILENGTLRASHIRYLNDTQEFVSLRDALTTTRNQRPANRFVRLDSQMRAKANSRLVGRRLRHVFLEPAQ